MVGKKKTREIDILKRKQKRDTKTKAQVSLLSGEAERTGKKKISFEKRRLKEDLISIYKYPKGGCKKNGTRLFSVTCSSRIRGHGQKQEHMWFPTQVDQ